MLSGIINVYKEAGYTSRDAVSRLTGILRQRKIGHTGTLDPAAEGVLPMCVGKATKLCEILTSDKKEYKAVLKLGFLTDTEDTTGVVVEETDFDDEWYRIHITEEKVKKILESFVGEQLQIPPMYSAKKINGKRLYELAREGKVIERKPAQITIYRIELESLDTKNREISITVECSKGTYIRTLCKDIGDKLRTKASMKQLLRTKTGNFTLEKSYRLDEIEVLVREDRVGEVMIPIEEIFLSLPKMQLTGQDSILLDNGAPFSLSKLKIDWKEGELHSKAMFRMYNEQNEFRAVYIYDEEKKVLKVDKFF